MGCQGPVIDMVIFNGYNCSYDDQRVFGIEELDGKGNATRRTEITFYDETGSPVTPRSFRKYCRSPSLLFMQNQKIYTANMREILKRE